MNDNEKKLLKEILDKVYETVTEYKAGYNDGGVKWEDYWVEGLRGLFQMVWLKVNRLKAHVFSGHIEDAIEDIIDLIAYEAFMYVWIKSKL